MGKPYSNDLRLRVLKALDGGMNKMTAHKTFAVSRSTIEHWIALRARTGSMEANTSYRRGKPPEITDVEMFRAFAGEHDGCALAQMAAAWHERTGRQRSLKFFSRALRRIGWTRKKRVFSTASATRPHETSS